MDESIWIYIIAAVIYFLTRGNKKKKPTNTNRPKPASSSRPQQQKRDVTFEDLLKEITSQREVESDVKEEIPEWRQEELHEHIDEEVPVEEEGKRRVFADDESRRVYEESVRQAEGFDIEYAPNEHFQSQKMFKGYQPSKRKDTSFAKEIRAGLKDADAAKKAIIYSEILKRKY